VTPSPIKSKKKSRLPWREFFDQEHYLWMLREYEAIRSRRKSFRGKPDQYDRVLMEFDKEFESFLRRFLD
jgi:hypothetical protein